MRKRYREERTLVRGLRRMPEQPNDEFRANVQLLKQSYLDFNRDVSGLCQWLMGIRPGGPRGFENEIEPLWRLFLMPEETLPEYTEEESDRIRSEIFRVIAFGEAIDLDVYDLSPDTMDAIALVSSAPLKPTDTRGQELFARLYGFSQTYLAILLATAADWVYARYQRLIEKWEVNHPKWEQEKAEWEKEHPELTEEVRETFTNIFRDLEIRRKNPRICEAEKLLQHKDNCDYAGRAIRQGETYIHHADLCYRYWKFCQDQSSGKRRKFNKKVFAQNGEIYLRICATNKKQSDTERMRLLFDTLKQKFGKKFKASDFNHWDFPEQWNAYLKAMNLNVTKMQNAGGFKHCIKFDKECTFNKHTDDCIRYRERLEQLPEDVRKLDKVYREWRKKFLSGPRRPSFVYPSSTSPVLRIFGKGYYRIDWKKSILGLRLENMTCDEFLEFRFKEWPSKYDVSDARDAITSVHLSFIGTRARIGFRFDIQPKQSRFRISQEDIEQLRSGQFAPSPEEREFPAFVREQVLSSFAGDPEKELRILAVDTGTTGGAAAGLFIGRHFQACEPLKLVKVEKLYNRVIYREDKKSQEQGVVLAKEREFKRPDGSTEKRKYIPGLSLDHYGSHLGEISEAASDISKKRSVSLSSDTKGLGRNDLRRLTLHIRWMIRDWARLCASQIIAAAEKHKADLILLESQRGFRAPGYENIADEVKKLRMAFWPYGLVRRKVTEKAVERGMRVLLAPYKGSSKTCPNCGALQKKSHFDECKKCKYKPVYRDESAVRVLGRVFWGEICLPEIKKS